MAKDRSPSSGLMKNTGLVHGSEIKHKWRSGVTGKVSEVDYDFMVEWSDGVTERLSSYDIGAVIG